AFARVAVGARRGGGPVPWRGRRGPAHGQRAVAACAAMDGRGAGAAGASEAVARAPPVAASGAAAAAAAARPGSSHPLGALAGRGGPARPGGVARPDLRFLTPGDRGGGAGPGCCPCAQAAGEARTGERAPGPAVWALRGPPAAGVLDR